MIANRETSNFGLSPGKAVAIGLLAIVLIAVIAMQFAGGDSSSIVIKKRSPRSDSGQSGGSPPAAPSPGGASEGKSSVWPVIPRSEALLYDPFAVPAWLKPKTTTEPGGSEPADEQAQREKLRLEQERKRAETVAKLKQSGVGMILMTPNGRVAKIGSLSVRVGDVVDGLRVAEIGPGGVVLVDDDEQPSP